MNQQALQPSLLNHASNSSNPMQHHPTFPSSVHNAHLLFLPPNPVLPVRLPSRAERQPTQLHMKSKRRPRGPSPNNDAQTHSRPARIETNNSPLSLRQQIKEARMNAQARKAVDSRPQPVVRTKFRRKKETSYQSGTASNSHDDADLPDGKYEIGEDPVLYIDAYNVIGAWPRLRKHRDRMDMETARRLLLHDVVEFSHIRGWDCVLVFDAHNNSSFQQLLHTSFSTKCLLTPNHFYNFSTASCISADATKSQTAQDVSMVFTGNETADSYIERAVYNDCEHGKRQVWAATSDIAHMNFSSSKGAHIMSSRQFIQEIKRARRETREHTQEVDEHSARAHMLIENVDKRTRDRLYQMRDRLSR